MAIKRMTLTAVAAGTDGSATGSRVSQHRIHGDILDIHFKRGANPVATTDVTIETAQDPAKPILTVSNLSADGWYRPRPTIHDQNGNELVGPADYVAINSQVRVSLAQANNGSEVTVTIEWDDGLPRT